MKDPLTGRERLVQLGSLSRLRTIFDTNLRTSYAAGQWERIQRVQDDLPYLRYSAVLDRRTRPQHRAWDGVVLPVDHPFWKTHFPPNGWRCRCSVTQFSEPQLEARGYKVSEEPPAGWDRTREWVNTRTGEVQRVQIGIDPGWGHNTGVMSSTQKLNRLAERLDDPQLDPGLARSMVREGIEDAAFLDFLSGAVPGDWPVAIVPEAILLAIRGRSRTVRLSNDSVENHPRFRNFETKDWLRVQRIADEGRVFKDGPQSAIVFFEEDGKFWAEAIKAAKDGEKTFMTSLHRAEPRHLRRAERNLDEIARQGR